MHEGLSRHANPAPTTTPQLRGGVTLRGAWRAVSTFTLAFALVLGTSFNSQQAVRADTVGAMAIVAEMRANNPQQAARTEKVGWAAIEVRGAASWRRSEADQWQRLQPGTLLTVGTQVRTGDNGYARLVDGGNDITMKPNSQMQLAAATGRFGITRILQDLGSIFYRVDKRKKPNFTVTTPYLVAVVKGTGFDVGVTEEGSTVDVEEGTVGVSSAEGGASVDVGIGETASVSAEPGSGVSVGTTGQSASQAAPGQSASAGAQGSGGGGAGGGGGGGSGAGGGGSGGGGAGGGGGSGGGAGGGGAGGGGGGGGKS